jgi:arylsulfatase A-like enzyme/Flp pilus assembly protein TadD
MKRTILGVTVLVTAIAGIGYYWRGSESVQSGLRFDSEPVQNPKHVLLITIDTLRADRLGSYGWDRARTPVVDGLARRGVRFTRAYATAPITLTSHATMLTGRYPPGHAARHNGMAMLADVPTLATRFKDAGFETGAFVSAFPLDSRFGLDRGFDRYDDELPRGNDAGPENERPGTVTVDRAIAWMRERPASARLFTWVHLFEPHAPYGTPTSGGSVAASASERYDEEIAVADREVGRLLDAWRDSDQTLIVLTADHGEAFGEHHEIGHSIFIYDTTLRVPLIFAGGGAPAGATVDAAVTLADIAPTIATWATVPPLDADGIDLRPVIDGTPAGDRALYAESFAPLLDFGWAPLRSLRRDHVKLIAAPRAELYDLREDPAEDTNVIAARGDLARELMMRVDRIAGPDLPTRSAAMDADAVARLRALGYSGGGRAVSSRSRPDPKDRIGIASRMAAVTSGELQGAAAEQALIEIVREDTGNVQAHVRLGFLMAESGRCDRAEPHFEAAIAGGVPSADAHLGLGMCQTGRGAAAEALATFLDARRVEPGNPVVDANIGLLELEAGRVEAATTALRAALAGDPNLHQARFALARALARAGDRDAAVQEATDLLGRLPATAPQRAEVERLLAALR